jgi:hypothetical protein
MTWGVLERACATWMSISFPTNDCGHHCFLGYYYHRLRIAFVRHFGSPFTLAVWLRRHGYIVFCGLVALHGFAGLVDMSWSFLHGKWRLIFLLDQTVTRTVS